MSYRTGAEKKGLLPLLRCVSSIAELNPGMPLGQAMTFLEVALHPGRGPKEYADTLSLPESTLSRWLLGLGHKDRGSTDVKVLEWRLNPENLRMKQYYLNPMGAALVNKCLAALEKV
jgi:hypothetical protein